MTSSRRSLLQHALYIAPLLSPKSLFSQAESASKVSHENPAPTTEPFVVRAGESRAGKLWTAGGVPHFWLKIGSDDTAGRLVLIEVTTPVNAGPPLHTHPRHNEFMYLLAGSFGIEVAGGRSILKTGDCFMAPRGVPHRYISLGPETAQHLNVCDPADDVQEFFSGYDLHVGASAAKPGAPPIGPPLRRSDFDHLM